MNDNPAFELIRQEIADLVPKGLIFAGCLKMHAGTLFFCTPGSLRAQPANR